MELVIVGLLGIEGFHGCRPQWVPEESHVVGDGGLNLGWPEWLVGCDRGDFGVGAQERGNLVPQGGVQSLLDLRSRAVMSLERDVKITLPLAMKVSTSFPPNATKSRRNSSMVTV